VNQDEFRIHIIETHSIYPNGGKYQAVSQIFLGSFFVNLSGDTKVNEFNSMLLTAVNMALAETMGDMVSGAIKATIQISTVSTDPTGFSTKLEKLTGGTKLVEHKIMRNLELLIAERAAKPVDSLRVEQLDFGMFIENCRGQYLLK